MGRSVTPDELRRGREEFNYGKNQLILEMLKNGKRIPKEGVETVSVKETLLWAADSKTNILNLEEKFEPYFKKCTGKKANTAKIFEKVIGRTAKQEEAINL